MSNGIRALIAVAAIIAVISIGAFLYLTREVAEPSVAVEDSAQQIEMTEASGEVVFRISQDESQVTYTINEVLNSADKTVIGATNEVAGDILLNLNDLSQAQIGEISINARTFETDEDRRDNSVARFVLQSEDDANEFITFEPTSISGLPTTASVGDTVQMQVTGNLTISGTTNEVTFAVTATLESAERLVGHAEVTVNYADFNLSIPDVPFVASVEDTVVLALDFVALAVE